MDARTRGHLAALNAEKQEKIKKCEKLYIVCEKLYNTGLLNHDIIIMLKYVTPTAYLN